jgi:hypothetical protein
MTSMDRRPHVPVAEFLYRHEAEFAAGFLRDAGIPFRLQIDDAGGADAGVTIARPAVLWVRAVDAERARELLSEDDVLEGEPPGRAQDLSLPDGASEPTRTLRPGGDIDVPRSGLDAMLVPLCRVERAVAGILALALFGLASYGGAGAVPWVGVWEAGALVGALVLGLSAVSGQTLSAIRAILRGLSGTAP